jgi:uncharacterized protein YjdB
MIIKKGYYKQITASILPSGAYNKEVNWSSSNSNIASVNNKGEVSAWRPGEATITCTAKDGSNTKAECSVIVLPEKMDYLYENLSGVTSTEVKISWTRYNYISGYSIFGYDSKLNEWKVVKDDISKDIGSVSVNSTINDGKYSGLKPSTQYSYKIGAYVLSNGTKYYGELSDAVITATSPNKVKLKSVSVNNKKVKLKWKKVQDATGYKVYAKRSGSNDYFLVETIKGQKKESYTYRSSLKGKYIFTVCAYKTYNGKNYIGDGTTKKVKIK